MTYKYSFRRSKRIKSPRRSSRRRSVKRKSPRRNSRRRSVKRKSPRRSSRRKSPRRNSRRRSVKRKSPRRSSRRKSPRRNSRRRSVKRKSPRRSSRRKSPRRNSRRRSVKRKSPRRSSRRNSRRRSVKRKSPRRSSRRKSIRRSAKRKYNGFNFSGVSIFGKNKPHYLCRTNKGSFNCEKFKNRSECEQQEGSRHRKLKVGCTTNKSNCIKNCSKAHKKWLKVKNTKYPGYKCDVFNKRCKKYENVQICMKSLTSAEHNAGIRCFSNKAVCETHCKNTTRLIYNENEKVKLKPTTYEDSLKEFKESSPKSTSKLSPRDAFLKRIESKSNVKYISGGKGKYSEKCRRVVLPKDAMVIENAKKRKYSIYNTLADCKKN
jgi:hypothetical protein